MRMLQAWVRAWAVFSMLTLWVAGANGQPFELPAAPAGVQTFTSQGIQFSRVQASNVAAHPATGNIGRTFGGGSWDFSIARTELTQASWVEFLNALNETPIPANQPYSEALETVLSGGSTTQIFGYIDRIGPQHRAVWGLSELGQHLPTAGLGWFGGALYCNWLQNNKSTSIDSVLTGAYDLRAFDGYDSSTWPSITRSATARYFIPTYDEWAIASFYDPDRFGPGQGAWREHLNRRDRDSISGPPGVGETSRDYSPPPPDFSHSLPVGAYPDSQSAFGLLDTSGSRQEVLDDVYESYRLYAGTPDGNIGIVPNFDRPGWAGVESPYFGSRNIGLRIATIEGVVPSPSLSLVFVASSLMSAIRRKR